MLADHRGGLRRPAAAAPGTLADVADRGRAPDARRSTRSASSATASSRVAVLGALLRRARRPDRAGLLRAGRAADRRARPAAACARSATTSRGRGCSGARCSRRPIPPARPSTRSTTRAGSTCWRSTGRRCSRCARRGSRPRGAAEAGFALVIDDRLDAVRPGQRLRLDDLRRSASGGPVDVQVTLPARARRRALPRGASFDPATRTLRFTLRRRAAAARDRSRARVARAARARDAARDDRLRQRSRTTRCRSTTAASTARWSPAGRADVGGAPRRRAAARVLRAPVGLHFVKSWRSNWGTGHAVVATATSCRPSGTRRWWSSSASRPSRACGSGPSSSRTTRPARSRTASRAR